MYYPKVRFVIFVALLTIASPILPLWFLSPALELQANAQPVEDRKAEADRLLNQGNQQMQTSQYRAALQSFEQALTIYRAVGNRNGEANALTNLGYAY